jgi:thiosulfate dehydrogenase [quinone] large subunit
MRRQEPTKKQLTADRRERPRLPAWAILPLRAFLGGTFIYAGLQKLTDPQFFDAASAGSLERQLTVYAQHSPLRWLLIGVAVPHATLIGWLIAVGELWIGGATLLGMLSRLAAGMGMLMSVLLWLTVTWTVSPYFLGSDSIYAVGWLTLVLTGPGEYCLDRWLVYRWIRLPGVSRSPRRTELSVVSKSVSGSRRVFFQRAASALLLLSVNALGGLVAHEFSQGSAGAQPQAADAQPGEVTQTPSSGGTPVGNVSQIPVNSALTFTLASTGDPGILVRLAAAQLVAFDAACTHAGCPVGYDQETRKLVCPCHGAIFDPGRQGAVLGGLASQPLVQVPVRIDEAGVIYVFG